MGVSLGGIGDGGAIRTATEYILFAVQIEVDGQHEMTAPSGDVMKVTGMYADAIAKMESEGVSNRAVRLIMLTLPLEEDLTEEQLAGLRIGTGVAIPATGFTLEAWIGEVKIEDVEQYLMGKESDTSESDSPE